MVTLDAPNGEWGKWLFKLRYDEAWGRYRYTRGHPRPARSAARAWAFQHDDHSRAGRSAGDAAVDAHRLAQHRRSDHADAKLQRAVPLSRFRCGAPHDLSALGHAIAHPSFNPTTIVHNTTVPLMYATCDQLFDQHLCWTNAAMDNIEADGFYHFKMSVEFANLRPAAAKEILEKAHDPVRTHRVAAGNGRAAVPFRMDVVNSFEEEIDPWAPVECPMLLIDKKQSGSVDWDGTTAHSGKKSIRLTAHHQAGPPRVFPDRRAGLCVKSQSRYKLTGWVPVPKTSNDSRGLETHLPASTPMRTPSRRHTRPR